MKPRIAIFSGPTATISNSPPLVTSNKARRPGERKLPGRYDHLVPQILYEEVTVKIKKYSAHPLEEDSSEVYHDDGKEFYKVTLSPEDGPYPLPYVARRKKEGRPDGVPFESEDLWDPSIGFGGRQFFYPDASRIFEEIDRGRNHEGRGSTLDLKASYDFIRVLPSAGYTKKGEVSGRDFFPYRPEPIAKMARRRDLAKIANEIQKAYSSGKYSGGIWLDGSPTLEETLYWLSLLIDTDLPIVGVAAQRTHGEISGDGDRNIIDAVDYINSGKSTGLGAVAVLDQVIFAAREVKKSDARPGNYRTSGGHGGVLGSVKEGTVTIWYRPSYKHTSESSVNLSKLSSALAFPDKCGDSNTITLQIKNSEGGIIPDSIPRVDIVKQATYSQEDDSANPESEVDIMARISNAKQSKTELHGLVYEGLSSYAVGSVSQLKALWIASLSGIPVVRVGRSDPGGRILTDPRDLTIEGSNLDANKARILLIAALLKLGRLPKARDPKNPTGKERETVTTKIQEFQEIFETH